MNRDEQNMLPSEKWIWNKREEFLKEWSHLLRRNKTLAKYVYFYFHLMFPPFWEDLGIDKPLPKRGRKAPSTKFITKLLECSTRTANDYAKTFLLLNKVDKIHDEYIELIQRIIAESQNSDVIRHNNGGS